MIQIEENIDPTQTSEESSEIQAISKDTVHKICSGQVILNLATAVKELVENSIDAGATTVEVKLKEYGSELIEVIDNGSGVEAKNFPGLTAKYCTSKLRQFTDLTDIATFGFRGEALSSLCALSDMVIVTRHKSADHGTKLELDNEGVIKHKSVCPRPIGTTVTLTNIFATLPVRKREFIKHIKREFTKMLQILQAYCLVATGVRIICSNQNQKGAKTTVLATTGSTSILDNVISIFGKKQMENLIELQPAIPKEAEYTDAILFDDEDASSSLDISVTDIDKLNLARFEIEGWISSCAHGSGRASRDRQYFYVNSRPCEPKHIAKMVNDVYHRYNVHQQPFVLLNLKIQRSDVDVNLTPDKRQVLVNNEKILLLALKKSLINTFGAIPGTFKMQNLDISQSFRRQSETNDADDDDEAGPNIFKLKPNPPKFTAMLTQWRSTGNTDEPCKEQSTKRKIVDDVKVKNLKLQKIHQFLSQEPPKLSTRTAPEDPVTVGSDSEVEISTQNLSTQEVKDYVAIRKAISDCDLLTPPDSEPLDGEKKLLPPPLASDDNSFHRIDCKVTPDRGQLRMELVAKSAKPSPRSSTKKTSRHTFQIECKVQPDEPEHKLIAEPKESRDPDVEIIDVDDLPEADRSVVSATITTTIADIKQMMEQENELKSRAHGKRLNLERLKFKAEINPSKNSAAETELQAEISKESFSRMEIIGQFNLGFIVVRLDDDLFIIDQHATDEKYNFETLQQTTVMQNQKCVMPQSLQLTAVNELILLENLPVFEMNGFKFQIDEDADPTKKVKLVAKPLSQNWDFGKEDIDELIFMLQDAPPSTTETCYRPSRIRAMFASRACRKSVMIGTALSRSTMQKLVQHMGEIDHPWNCPHGRPTMRHLVNLAMLDTDDSETSSVTTESD